MNHAVNIIELGLGKSGCSFRTSHECKLLTGSLYHHQHVLNQVISEAKTELDFKNQVSPGRHVLHNTAS